MALYFDKLIPVVLKADGTLTVADDKDVVTMPFTGRLVHVDANVSSTGTTSGNNDFVLEDDGTDLWTVAAGVGRIAYNASVNYQAIPLASLDNGSGGPVVAAGSLLALNVDAVAGGTPANLKVIAWFDPS